MDSHTQKSGNKRTNNGCLDIIILDILQEIINAHSQVRAKDMGTISNLSVGIWIKYNYTR